MAKGTKTKALKAKLKAKSAKQTTKTEVQTKGKATLKLVAAAPGKNTKQSKTAPVAKAAESKVSQKLLETIERRKKEKEASGANLFGKPMARRGRRPKAMAEYVPSTNQEEENYSGEENYEALEYDTGIRIRDKKDEHGFSLDRFEDFDEELNFDW